MEDAAKRYYDGVLRRSREYWDRKKQAKIDAGTYKGRGRPRKEPTPPPQNPEVAVVQTPV